MTTHESSNEIDISANESHYVQVQTPRKSTGARRSSLTHGDDDCDSTHLKTKSAQSTTNSSSGDKLPAAVPATSVSFFALYRFATPRDIVTLVLGVVMAAVNGALYPCMALVFGDAVSSFAPFDRDGVNRAALDYFLIAITLFVTDCLAFALFARSAERQMKALREHALQHLLHLDIAWFDSHDAMQLSSRITGDTLRIKAGMGQKLGEAVKFISQFVGGFTIGFIKGWDIALVMCCATPLMVGAMSSMIGGLRVRAVRAQQLYAEAGAVAEETLASMRTVASLNGEARALAAYNAKTATVEHENIVFWRKASVMQGIYTSSLWFMYAAGLWYGGKKVFDGDASPGTVFQAFFGVLLGSQSMGQIMPNLSAVAEAKGSAAALFAILDTEAEIHTANNSNSSNDGLTPATCSGAIEARGVYFAYPSRLDAPILNNYSVTIAAGEKVAFVGPSGGGKSTLIALLERFYDPSSGSLLLDGVDIKTLNVQWLRSQIGLVGQEPVLFATTIYENIAAGGDDSITHDRVVAAAKRAHAHDFIMALPQQYDTLVGEKGVSLSGGQKQRVAIARAIVRQPAILVLDEATSALDAESERVVQAALDDLMNKTQMTTLVIAHRLSTVRSADKIVVVANGAVVEQGDHAALMAIDSGVYRNLYTLQEERATKEAQEAQEAHDAVAVLDESTTDSSDCSDSNDLAVKSATHKTVGIAAADELERPSDVMSVASAIATQLTLAPSAAPAASKFTIKAAMDLSRPERSYFVRGITAAALHGLAVPSSALLISELLAVMNAKYEAYQLNNDAVALHDDLAPSVTAYGLCYVGGAIALLVIHAQQAYNFRYMAEKLTSRLRDLHFSSLLRQDIAFFDKKENSTGALTSDLAMHAAKVSLVSGDSQGRLLQAMFTFGAAVLLSFTTGSWILTLVLLAVFPLLLCGEILRFKQMKGAGGLSDELAASGAHASEALCNIRTVVALGLERRVSATFSTLLEKPLRNGEREAVVNGMAVGFSSFIVFATYALVFYYGGTLVENESITFKQLIRTLMAIMMSAQGVAYAASWLGESDHALHAGSAIFALRDYHPRTVDSFAETGLTPACLEGAIEYRDVTFRYPTRPHVTVLKHFSLKIGAGQTVAFCGPSGGGKSTVIALLERFYDPAHGHVLLDGVDTRSLNVRWLRSQIGFVGQEPTLFVGTIAENIAFGLVDASIDAIQAAAKMANAHDFITRFPDGYATQVGMKGEQLSGGQKQRIAIARAMLKNPTILLLDEATSALDAESEQVVQDALDKVVALKRRTTLIIAHRLSTIRNADTICVVSDGRVAEQGAHDELLAMGGIYTTLVGTAAHK